MRKVKFEEKIKTTAIAVLPLKKHKEMVLLGYPVNIKYIINFNSVLNKYEFFIMISLCFCLILF